ncbi:MAG: adenine deaminase [Catalinimonas sp.]
MKTAFTLTAQLVDVHQRRIYPADIRVEGERIAAITPVATAPERYVMPGFVDAHVHVESSMLVPSEFARLAVVHGTVATVSDPHEIANVLGGAGVDFMIENGRQVPFKFCFGAPSCVPATPFETAGATLGVDDVDALLARPEVGYLSEMMNWPGVLNDDAEVLAKIERARAHGKPVDGHAPGLRGEEARRYAAAGISTDHECFTAEEARDKLAAGMKVLIREGSAARNFNALIALLPEYPDRIMFCTDDMHPDTLVAGHINELVRRALARGIDLFTVLRAASVNAVEHYNLPVGLLRPGDPADFIVTDRPDRLRVRATFLNGGRVADEGRTLLSSLPVVPINRFVATPRRAEDFAVSNVGGRVRVIEADDGQLVTRAGWWEHGQSTDTLRPAPDEDVLKIAVVNRYADAPPAVAFVRGFGLKRGALASSVAHDSHNIVAVGTTDQALCRAVNAVIEGEGGVAVVDGKRANKLALPVAGLMSGEDGYRVAERYAALDRQAKLLGSTLGAPFMTLSFMALLVIPALKLSDKGLFDGAAFRFVNNTEA